MIPLMRIAVLFVLAALVSACGREAAPETDVAAAPNEQTPPEHAATEAHAAPAVVAEHTAPLLPPGDRRLDARGIVVTRHVDGTISVVGDDRWGGHIDTTYADGHYFKHAVDTLARSLTDPQAAALRETIPELAPEAMNDTAPPVPAGATRVEHR
jgi:hypothetical protein